MLTYANIKKTVGTKPLQWGRKNEAKTRNKYRKELKGNHCIASCKESGLIISPVYPFLAASPDGEVYCKCHADGLYEVKCPWSHRGKNMKEYVAQKDTFLQINEKKDCCEPFQLKCSHKYYSQVQHAMFVSQKGYCDFHVYLPKESFVQRITVNDSHGADVLPKLQKFFDDFIAPELFTKKLLSKEIVLQILNDIINKLPVN